MNEWQLLKHLRNRLRAATWDSGSLVWGTNVKVIPGGPAAVLGVLASANAPLAVIVPGSGQVDPDGGEETGLHVVQLTVVLAQAVSGDTVGEHAILGANIRSETRSGGKGLIELQERLYNSIAYLSSADGVDIEFRGVTQADTVPGDRGHVVYREYGFEAAVGIAKHFPPAKSFNSSSVSGGVAALSWKLPASRFDLYRLILRRDPGATPPEDTADGTGVTLASSLPTSHDDSGLAAGQYSYALFVTYDDRSSTPDSDDNVSASVTTTVTVI